MIQLNNLHFYKKKQVVMLLYALLSSHLYQAICKYSRQPYLLQQRLKS
uniref:Uncharacterized protein n=1 Tax=Siphoviridae sp. ctxvK3 TaxID=2827975 RepID=A0A8S5SGP7_9CAUD|nr:MAG TPA: hypothetical protein [Siphoviridae sp. ctxvK3]